MLTRIEINRYRSCEGVVIDNIGPILAFIGRNGAGKTNIFRAIDQMAKLATDSGAGQPYILNRTSIVGSLQVRLGSQEFRYELDRRRDRRVRDIAFTESVKVRSDGADFSPVLTRVNDDLEIHLTQSRVKLGPMPSSLTAVVSLFPPDDPVVSLLRPLVNYFVNMRYCPLVETDESSESEVVREEQQKAWEGEWAERPTFSDSVAHNLIYLKNRRPEIFVEIEELLGSNGLGLVDDISVSEVKSGGKKPSGEPANYFFVRFAPSNTAGSLFSFDDLSLGTRRIIRLVIQLTAGSNSVLLLEHPEDGIHRGLLCKLVDVIKNYCDPLQVFVTSHSPYVLNSLGAENIRLVHFHDGATRVRALTPDEVAAASGYLESQGTLGDFVELIEDGGGGE